MSTRRETGTNTYTNYMYRPKKKHVHHLIHYSVAIKCQIFKQAKKMLGTYASCNFSLADRFFLLSEKPNWSQFHSIFHDIWTSMNETHMSWPPWNGTWLERLLGYIIKCYTDLLSLIKHKTDCYRNFHA